MFPFLVKRTIEHSNVKTTIFLPAFEGWFVVQQKIVQDI